jgi:GT2 family glycosyltransferase
VVVSTRDRPEELERSLSSLLVQRYADFEIVVVDSAPSTDATELLVRTLAATDSRLRYLRESLPGLSRARNRGLAEARGWFIAFTDDDVRVDAGWLGALASGFAVSEDVGCVTGLSLPAELESPAQVLFEQFGGFRGGFERIVFDGTAPRDGDPLYPYRLGAFGSGLNMAFRGDAIRRLGGFDLSLGAGSPTGGGEDIDAFIRLVRGGGRLVYEPRAIVWHYHRREIAGLRRQLRGSGSGMSALMTKLLLSRSSRVDLLCRTRPGFRYLLSSSSPKNEKKGPEYPRSLTWAELVGVLLGPFMYSYAAAHHRWRGRG